MEAFATDLGVRFRTWLCHLFGHHYAEAHSGWVRCSRCEQVWHR